MKCGWQSPTRKLTLTNVFLITQIKDLEISCITKILELKGHKDILPIHDQAVVEGGGHHRGYEFLITFVEHGHRCGYVAIPPGVKFDTDELCVHGGITFEDESHAAKDLLPTHCSDTWLGFDAAHWGDMRCYDTALKYFGHNEKAKKTIEMMKEIHLPVYDLERKDPSFSHKTYKYMVEQCKSLIDQLIEQEA